MLGLLLTFICGDMDVKKLLLIAALIILSGCDEHVNGAPQKLTIASMIASGKEERTTECVKGSVTLKCEFLSGDLLGSGKWHHAIIHIAKSGELSLTIDNVSYYQTDASSGFVDGEKYANFDFSGLNNAKATLHISNSNDGSQISLDAWDQKENQFMTASN